MKIYDLESNQSISSSDLQASTGVISLENTDLKEVMNLLSSGKYSSFDEVTIDQNTSQEILNKFSQEHLHDDDEVRYFLEGNSIFDVRSPDDRWIRIETSEKDFIALPKNLYHRFFAPEKAVKALRLFTSKDGWTPIYR